MVTINTLPEFTRRAKRLAKKYQSFKEDLRHLVESLQQNPMQGVSLGKGGVYKVRMSIAAKGGGKRGGARVITFVVNMTSPGSYEVTLLTIYDKSEIQNVSDSYLKSLIETLLSN